MELRLSRKEDLFAAETLLSNRCVHYRARTCTHEYALGVRVCLCVRVCAYAWERLRVRAPLRRAPTDTQTHLSY